MDFFPFSFRSSKNSQKEDHGLSGSHTFSVFFLKREKELQGARGKISIFVRLDHRSVLDMAHNQEEVDHHLC
jgi:hypothetical protein